MSKTGTTRVSVKAGEPLSQGETDWARLDGMSEEALTAAALADPDAQPLSSEQLARMRPVSRVKVLRQRLGMTQVEFSHAFHLPITTLRDWEQQRSTPDAPARALLLAIERDPEMMRKLLAERAA
ncbi:helix-turn-helix domain-containing protein [Bradyrhizobium sp. USDA 4353]